MVRHAPKKRRPQIPCFLLQEVQEIREFYIGMTNGAAMRPHQQMFGGFFQNVRNDPAGIFRPEWEAQVLKFL